MSLFVKCSKPYFSEEIAKINLSDSPLFVDKYSVSKKKLREYFVENYGTDNPVPKNEDDNREMKRALNDLEGLCDEFGKPTMRKMKKEGSDFII